MNAPMHGRTGNRTGANGEKPGYLRPKDAATILILDKTLSGIRVLMGRRPAKDAFMPAAYVFPGGRVDPTDGRAFAASELDPIVRDRLMDRMRPKPSAARARGLALCALRETAEETGYLIGKSETDLARVVCEDWAPFRDARVAPDLGALRLLARAITPPGRVRRFDSRFFVVWADAIALAPDGVAGTGELENIAWPTLDEADDLELPRITRSVIHDLKNRLVKDPALSPGGPAVFYRPVGETFVHETL
ncbi:NUDIX domain protein [Hartmannibacter diazotrophicus]|uniref:NUDIX domain protein n=1 Tax=Hartmannibacter diazotrophicus TaxID=1482074 RepID=A0A2C9D774_9HYPH|nr:NUDIX hydrolase [Hartmannibacter diazotrophicus]SON55601.1 NUDIX domain protein [Hartmannibacter diazotrophicus]